MLESRLARMPVANGSTPENQAQGFQARGPIEESLAINRDVHLDNYNPGLDTRNGCRSSKV